MDSARRRNAARACPARARRRSRRAPGTGRRRSGAPGRSPGWPPRRESASARWSSGRSRSALSSPRASGIRLRGRPSNPGPDSELARPAFMVYRSLHGLNGQGRHVFYSEVYGRVVSTRSGTPRRGVDHRRGLSSLTGIAGGRNSDVPCSRKPIRWARPLTDRGCRGLRHRRCPPDARRGPARPPRKKVRERVDEGRRSSYFDERSRSSGLSAVIR